VDWVAWHESYDRPGSYLRRRLELVQGHLRRALAACPPGSVRLVSACAGQGRDVIGVLREHPRRTEVQVRLIELDPRVAADARAFAAAAGLAATVEVLEGDAGAAASYAGAAAAHLVLMCGVFGNVEDEDVRATVHALPELCAPEGFVIWTRHRRPPDLTPRLREWFTEVGFRELAFDVPADHAVGVGLHRLVIPPRPFVADRHYFTFTRTR
jgi:hypothetical protein